MKIAITGANGFIGQAVVEAALARGHEVVAVIRSNSPVAWSSHQRLSVAQCDLLNAPDIAEHLRGCEVVLHLAAVMHGQHQHQQTLQLTRQVLSAMDQAGVKRLVGLSSISTLDYVRQSPLSCVEETLPTNGSDLELGTYALMKRDQERCYLQWQQGDKSLVILRPGIVYTEKKLSDAHVGFQCFAASHNGQVPVVHVNSVASAAIAAAEESFDSVIFHLLNDALPSQREYIAQLKTWGLVGKKISLPWPLFSLLMGVLRFPLSLIGRVPDSVYRNSVAARQKPFRFSNEKAKKLLNWQPHRSIDY